MDQSQFFALWTKTNDSPAVPALWLQQDGAFPDLEPRSSTQGGASQALPPPQVPQPPRQALPQLRVLQDRNSCARSSYSGAGALFAPELLPGSCSRSSRAAGSCH